MNPPLIRFDARAVADGAGLCASPGSLLVRFDHPRIAHRAMLLAAGATGEVPRHPDARAARVVSLPNSILIPGLVNAHTHLDLTHIGPQPHDPAAGFVSWVDLIRARRAATDEEVAASVRRGIELSLAGGAVAVGDIGGVMPPGRLTLTPWRVLRESPLLGVSYVEFFAIGRTVESRIEAVGRVLAEAAGEVGSGGEQARLGLQPHAPYSVGLRAFRWAVEVAARHDLPLCTHLAETPEERRFIAAAEGPQRALLERVGVWEEGILTEIGRGLHPVAHLAEILAVRRFTVAHVNDADDAAIETLARTGTSVVYCPRASAYFGAPGHFGPHRYREMLEAGVPVALGTDSVVNLPEPVSSLGVLDEMRLLHARDGTPPEVLLRMGTVHGALALGLPADEFIFKGRSGGWVAGIVRVDLEMAGPSAGGDALGAMMRGTGRPSLLSGEISSD